MNDMTAVTTAKSHIFTEVDYDADGKQLGYLHLPHSVTRSAYGTIAIPIVVIKNGKGPSALLMAGNHGDEYEGQVTLCRLVREIEPQDIKGRLIIMPAANLPAAMAGARVSPIDEGNLNRAFPGGPHMSVTYQIAHYLDTVVVPKCEVWFDLHSGGGSLDYVPFASIMTSGNKALDRRSLELLKAFSAPVSMVWSYLPDARLAHSSAHRNNVVYLGGEFGGGASVNPGGVKLTYDGTVRALAHMGILKDTAKFKIGKAPAKVRWMELLGLSYYVYAPDHGLFEPAVKLGSMVKKGQLAGLVHFVDNPAREPVPAYFKDSGLVICQRHYGRVERGDCVAHLATDRKAP
jgi:predicted deacylase